MQVTNISESLTIRAELAEAPNAQLDNSVSRYTLRPDEIEIRVFNGALVSILLGSRWAGYERRFEADDHRTPNWVRDLVVEILADHEVTWPLADKRESEYEIHRRAASGGTVLMSVAIVDPAEVRSFLMTKREQCVAADFVVAHEGDETVDGQRWLALNKNTKVSA